MPGRPSTISEIESPTGCTKQLMSVACIGIPAAELMRPAGMKPASIASWKRRSQWACLSGTSATARAHLLDRLLLALGVLLEQRLAADLLVGERGDGGAGFQRFLWGHWWFDFLGGVSFIAYAFRRKL